MIKQYKIGLSKQAIRVYKILLVHRNLSATDIGARLNIAPTAVYRLVEHLISLGMITAGVTRPVRYGALDPSTAREYYTLAQRSWFSDSVASQDSTIFEQTTDASFISGRSAVFTRITKDYALVKRSVCMIILGLSEGISPELLLAQKNAVDRGVQCRIVVQEYGVENKDTVQSWIHNGAMIRHGQPIGFHLVVLDHHISYMMWYEERNRQKRTAVRFAHPGIARELQKVFETHWRKAVPI